MQSEYLIPVAEAIDVAVFVDFDDPQAAIAIVPTIAATTISILWSFG
jgi:D-mannonate dehydratase